MSWGHGLGRQRESRPSKVSLTDDSLALRGVYLTCAFALFLLPCS
jgi:hypothetical protein